ncbi:MAG: class I SAM-dependent methyltransferase [Planctomycetes bacterium]|nr:class I SAM-dependent methyltransferase [Planctomycetota bacterium]
MGLLGKVRRRINRLLNASPQNGPVINIRKRKEGLWQSSESVDRYVAATSQPTVAMSVEEDFAEAWAQGWTLDVGAGTGRFSRRVAAQGHPVVAVDISAAMLEAGLKIASRPYFCNVCSAYNLPAPDECFDTVISFWFLLHFGEWPNLLREMARVLKPGGRLVVEVMNRAHLDAGIAIRPDFPMAINSPKPDSFTAWVSPDEARAVLEPLGLFSKQVVQYDLFTENAIAQARLGAGYNSWIQEIQQLMKDPDCRQYWRRFEQLILPKLPESTGRRLILCFEKGLNQSSQFSYPSPPPPVGETPTIRRSLELFRAAYGDILPATLLSEMA